MNRLLLSGLAFVTFAFQYPPPDALSRFSWLAGCWEQFPRGHGGRTLEMWMPPAGGLMLGASRSVSGPYTEMTRVVEWEHLRLSVRDGRVIYTALPSGQNPTDFTAVSVSDSGFTVENLTHDFPQRIIYARRGTDSLLARIEGKTPQGIRGVDFPMRRVSCEARP